MLAYYDHFGRKNLPWQQHKTAYRVWVSEIMLQQTQVKTVMPYYDKFMISFPNITSLAIANIDDVLLHWAGLGYYSRARNLHKCAKQVVEQFDGKFPRTLEAIIELPGIGESTGGAILSLAFDLPEAILDGNVKRVLARVFLIEGWYGTSSTSKALWQICRKYTPNKRTADFNQSMMDLGASLCSRTNPQCDCCPLSINCLANRQGKTSEFPHKKPKKQLETRETLMTLSVNDKNQVQLLKRPPVGIWGGLWSLPEVINSSIEFKKPNLAVIDEFKHTFSHFHLQIKVIKPNSATQVQDNSGLAWHNVNSISQLALPTPIKKFLYKHFNI